MMKTGKVYGMKESDNEALSNHTGTESYFDDPQGLGGTIKLLIDPLQKQTFLPPNLPCSTTTSSSPKVFLLEFVSHTKI